MTLGKSETILQHSDKNHIDTKAPGRAKLLDFYRGSLLLFVFFHHVSLVVPGGADHFSRFNPFAELFVGLAGFMVGFVYLKRNNYQALASRGWRMIHVYLMLAIPIGMASAAYGVETSAIWSAAISAATFQDDRTSIGILRFYGITFVALPTLLILYNKSTRIFVLVSAMVFAGATHCFHETLFRSDSFFLKSVILFQLQWQFLFFVGVALGEKYRDGSLRPKALLAIALIMVPLAFAAEHLSGVVSYGDKVPYTFEKFLNLLWEAPVALYLLKLVFDIFRRLGLDDFVINVGRNSLLAFVISELVQKSVMLLMFQIHPEPSSIMSFLLGTASVLIIVGFMWYYESYWKKRHGPLPFLHFS